MYERKTEITPLPEGKPEQWTWGSNGCTSIENDDSPMNSNMLYKWIVLWGSIPEVIKEVETNLPVVMLETNVVWDGFEEDEGKSEICYTYPFSHAWGGKYAKVRNFKVLFSGQGEMVAKMFNKNLEDVRVLVPEFC